MSEIDQRSPEDWATWLLNYLRMKPVDPQPEPYFDDPFLCLDHFLGTIGEDARTNFSSGLTLALEATPSRPENARVLYYLFDLVSNLTPVGAKTVMRQRLFSGVLWNCSFIDDESQEPIHLQTLALSVCAAYAVDESLSKYIIKNLPKAQDFKFVLTGIRLLSRWREQLAQEWIDRGILAIRDRYDAERLVRELQRASNRHGYRELAKWLAEKYFYMRQAREAQLKKFNDAWMQLTPSWEQTRNADDPHKRLISALTFAQRTQLSPRDLLDVASLHERVEPDLVAYTLCVLLYGTPKGIAYISPEESPFADAIRDFDAIRPKLTVEENDGSLDVPDDLRHVFDLAEKTYGIIDEIVN